MTNEKKRNRRTREEMLAHYQAQIDRLNAAMEGGPDTSTEAGILKSLRNRLRKTQTALRAASITLNGDRKADGTGWVRPPIEEKIQKTERRLADQRETQARAASFVLDLPSDVTRLEALIAAGEQGEEIEYPKDLTPLTKDEERTDEEHEAAFIAKSEESN